jgi:RND family efflux transporter MFP subunit
MSNSSDRDPSMKAVSPSAENDSSGGVAYIDKTLWDKLSTARSAEEMAIFWLDLQCRMLDGVARAAVYLCTEQTDSLVAVGFWPEDKGDGPTSLLATAKRAINEQRGVVSGHLASAPPDSRLCCAAYPFLVNGASVGAVSVEIVDRSEEQLRAFIRQLQWGVAWIELGYQRNCNLRHELTLATTGGALDITALLVETSDYGKATKTLVTELATRLSCELVAVSWISGNQHKVAALSHSAEFGRRMNLVRAMVAAMSEAADQESIVCWPVIPGEDYRVTRAHEELATQLEGACILTIPLLNDDKPVGTLLFQWPTDHALEQPTIDLCDAMAAVVGPILDEKRKNSRLVVVKVWDAFIGQLQRLFGPRYLTRKLVLGTALILVMMFSFLESTYRVSSPASIEGRVQRVTVAPFDGYIASQSVRAGDQVKKGDVLAQLDGRDLTLELLRWTATRQQRIAESDKAIAQHDRAQVNIIDAQIEQANARIALLQAQLQRVELVAAFDGIIVAGDLSQSIGAAVKRGEELFRIAPLDAYRIILEVDEADVGEISEGMTGEMKLASLLDDTLPYTIERITPITESLDGRNYFRVEARLEQTNQRLRPGMEGVAKTEAGERLLIWIWTEDTLKWLRLTLWAWWP